MHTHDALSDEHSVMIATILDFALFDIHFLLRFYTTLNFPKVVPCASYDTCTVIILLLSFHW